MNSSRALRSNAGPREVGINVRHPLLSLRNDIDSLFSSWFSDSPSALSQWESGAFNPKLEVREDAKEVVVTAELPGLTEEDIDISLDDEQLVIRGHKKQDIEREEKGYFYTERSYGSFERRLRLSEPVDNDAVDASFSKGVLTIKLPKLAEDKRKARKVSVRSA